MKQGPRPNETLMLAHQGNRILTEIEKALWALGPDQERSAEWLLRSGWLARLLSSNLNNFTSELLIPANVKISTKPTDKTFTAGQDQKLLLPGTEQGGNYDYTYLELIQEKGKNAVDNYFLLFKDETLKDDTALSQSMHRLANFDAQTNSKAFYLVDLFFEAQ